MSCVNTEFVPKFGDYQCMKCWTWTLSLHGWSPKKALFQEVTVIPLKFYKSEWHFFYLLNLHCSHTSAMPSIVFIITCWMWGSSLVGLVPPPDFFSILGPGFCCTCGSGSGCGCRGACRLELRPQAHSQSLLSSISESARLSWITGSPLTNTMVLRTLSYVVRELMFWRFAGPQSDVGWHSSRTLWKVLVVLIAEVKEFLAIIVFWNLDTNKER